MQDAIIAEEAEHLQQPAWVNENRAKINSLGDLIYTYKYNKTNDELGRLLGGPLLGRITSDMAQLQHHLTDDQMPYKLNLYSGHDTSLLALAAGLDVHIDSPTFASCILIELYQTVGEGLVVEMCHRNSGTQTPVKLAQCEFS